MFRRRFVPAALVVALATLLTACTGKDAVGGGDPNGFRFVSANVPGKSYPIDQRKPAGAFSAGLLDGNGSYGLKNDLGKVVVINFWASWCSPCRVETPQFDNVYREYKGKGVTFVGVDTKDTHSGARAFVQNYDITYPMVFDPEGQIAIELGKIPALALPFTVVVDKDGRVAAVYAQKLAPNDLTPVLNTLLAET
jgi:peroxiredoxin